MIPVSGDVRAPRGEPSRIRLLPLGSLKYEGAGFIEASAYLGADPGTRGVGIHMFKFRNGKIELIQAVFGGRMQDAIWPDERK